MGKLINKDLYAETIKKVINKEFTQKQAALKLEISDRQVRRLINKYYVDGEEAFIHKNINNKYAKKISDDLANEIISPYAQHKTVRLYNENMKNAIREKKITESPLNINLVNKFFK